MELLHVQKEYLQRLVSELCGSRAVECALLSGARNEVEKREAAIREIDLKIEALRVAAGIREPT
jgi:hypothetical protein